MKPLQKGCSLVQEGASPGSVRCVRTGRRFTRTEEETDLALHPWGLGGQGPLDDGFRFLPTLLVQASGDGRTTLPMARSGS